MKKIWLLTTLFFWWFLLAWCTTTNEEVIVEDNCDNWVNCEVVSDVNEEINTEANEIDDLENDDTLILVFSPTWNTKRMAWYISDIIGADLTEIVPTTWYTTWDLNWRDNESRTYKEFKNPDIRPEIETDINIDWYDTIYLWFPIWFWITPNIILTLLENTDFSGKNLILFCTSEHVWIENAVKYLEPYNLNVLASHRFAQDTTKEMVKEWIESL